MSRDGRIAIAADPDRDRVMIVDLVDAQVLGSVALQAGDEPGRLVEDDARHVHVALRSAGQLAAIDLDTRQIVSRRDVCSVPQGVAYEPAEQMLEVACADGQLVTLAAAGGDVVRRVHVDSDLRDVIVSGDQVFVTRFKNAELLRLDAAAGVLSRARPAAVQGPFVSPSVGSISSQVKTFDAAVAWRTLMAPDGRFVMVHQRDQVDEIALPRSARNGSTDPATDADAGVFNVTRGGKVGAAFEQPLAGTGGGSAYGSGVGCDGIVQAGVTYMDGDGHAQVDGPLIPGLVLPVDAAISPDGRWLAIASAGSFQPRNGVSEGFGAVVMPMGLTPKPELTAAGAMQGGLPFPNSDADGGVDVAPEPLGPGRCLMPGRDAPGLEAASGQVVAVAFDHQGRLLMQTRDPNRIRVLVVEGQTSCEGCETYALDIDLGGVSRRDAGHDLFHGNAGGGLACASCHPGGGDDGRTWHFADLGPRRTQLFNMGIRDTAPLHWDGAFSNLNELLLDVFVQRMGGGSLQLSEGEALADYLDSLHPNAPMRSSRDKAARRGKALFESTDVGCATCHNGPKLTNNKSVDVGTGGVFQVPSLIGVAYHQPYLHNGCAQTLRERFDPGCGGASHGKTDGLKPAQIDDLVAYLESL